MLYKRFIALLTVVLTALSIFGLTFTWKAWQVERQAEKIATAADGSIDFKKKQAYLIDKWDKTAYKVFWKEYTLEEVEERRIALGLDLQHGMHMTLEIDIPAILVELAGMHGHDPLFRKILREATQAYLKDPQKTYLTHFYTVYKRLMPNRPLHNVFFNTNTKSWLSPTASDTATLAGITNQIKEKTTRSLKIFSKRLNRYGTSSVTFRRAPRLGTIEVEVQGVVIEHIKTLLEKAAQLIFHEVETDASKITEVAASMREYSKSKQVGKQTKKKAKNKPLSDLILPAQGQFVCRAEDIKEVRKRLAADVSSAFLSPGYALLPETQPMRGNEKYYAVYLVKTGREGKGILTGEVITSAYHNFHQGRCQVVMKMDGKGTKKWSEYTGTHIGKPVAMAVDGEVISAPMIQQKIADGISVINSDDMTIEWAKVIANMLESGSLAASFKRIEETITGPTLGKIAQQQAMWAIIIALLLIILFMMLYYSIGGVIANIALLFNMLFILGALAQINAALTLPGIAGIMLTFGMTVDANVLIFERIREELKLGIYMKNAIANGYRRAYSSIIDSNLTTLLTGVILYVLGQGPIKGFATTLIIGIISSLFTAVLLTRLLIELMGPHRLSVGFGFTKNLLAGLRIDFFAWRKYAYLFSLAIMLFGGFCIHKKGLQIGVDFTGGRSYVVEFDSPVSLAGVKKEVGTAFEGASVEAKTYGSTRVVKIISSYQMNDQSVEGDKKVQQKLIEALIQETGKKYLENPKGGLDPSSFTIATSTKIGAAIASYVLRIAIYAILLSLLMIFSYILLRFRRWQYGLAAVIALTHDVLIAFSALGIARFFGISYELDQVVIGGGFLTLIGYSINDTVVVFDRLREKIYKKGERDFRAVANEAVNETMSRTLITSLTTLLAVVTIFLFGGEALRGFSFTLLVGIIFGTYSSIFATPLAHDLATLVGKIRRKK